MRIWAGPGPARPTVPRARKILALVVLGLLGGAAVFLLLAEQQLRVPLQHWADTKATNIATLAISRAVERVLRNELPAVDLVQPLSGGGKITGLSYAWSDLLSIKLAVTEAVLGVLDEIAADTIPVPLGELTGMYLFAAFGPAVRVRIIPIGAVQTDMRFDFLSQGINQVLHRIYLDIKVRMRVVAPFTGTEILVHEQIPVATELIQGEVPEAMIHWQGTIEELRNMGALAR